MLVENISITLYWSVLYFSNICQALKKYTWSIDLHTKAQVLDDTFNCYTFEVNIHYQSKV